MAKKLLLCIISVIVAGCSEKAKIYTYSTANPDPTPSVTPDTVTLALDKEYPLPGADNNDIQLFRVRDTMLFYSENKNMLNHLNIYDIKGGRLMQSLLLPDSFTQSERSSLAMPLAVDIEPDTVSMLFYLWGNGRLRYAISDLAEGRIKTVRLPNVSDTYILPQYYKDGYYICKTFRHRNATDRIVNPDNGYERLYSYIPGNAKVKYLTTDLKSETVVESNPYLFVNTGCKTVSHERGIYVFAASNINHLIFFDLNDDFILKPIREINNRQYAPWLRAEREDKTEPLGCYHFYIQAQPSDNFVYLLFYGFRDDDKEKHSVIVKYDWSGDLKTIYRISEGLCYSFAVTEDDERMFLEVETDEKTNVFEVTI